MVDAVYLDCLSTSPGGSDSLSMEDHYLIPTKLQGQDAVTKLEYYWGMEKGQLSLRTPLNVLHLSSDMEDSMGFGGWTISPPIPMLKEILSMQRYNSRTCAGNLRGRRLFTEVFPVGMYEYDFIPLRFREPIFVRRVDDEGLTTYTRYESPYVDFPRIKSHAHPFFVLYSSYHQIALSAIAVPTDRRTPIVDITRLWFVRVPPEFLTSCKIRTTIVQHSRKYNDSPRPSDSSPNRGVKRPHTDEDVKDDEEEWEDYDEEDSEEKSDEDDDDDDDNGGSSIIPITTPPASDSIRTPKDPSSPLSPPYKRLKLDLSVLGSDILYTPKGLLRWIRDVPRNSH